MMINVPGGNVRQRAHGKLIPTGDAGALPSLCRQVAKEWQGCPPDLLKFLDMAHPWNVISAGAGHGDLLVKAGQRRIESTGKPESAKYKHALAVIQMVQHFANAPLPWPITVERFLFGDASKECGGLIQLALQPAHDVGTRDPVNVGEI